jgi:hypothetical protein
VQWGVLMCKGLAVVAEKIDEIWEVYAKKGCNSHDTLLHELREDLRDGKAPHIKFEVYFPMVINDDIQQDVAIKGGYYPVGWLEFKFGKWIACPESVFAVVHHLNENKNLLDFDSSMLQHASLNDASLNRASLDGASLNDASLNRASLDGASLDGASLNDASLNRASLNDASLNRASLDGASLNDASLNRASLNRASLDGASLVGASLDGASLNRASLNRASLNDASLNRASLDGASLNDASFTKTQLIKFWAEIKVAIFDHLYINLEIKTRDEVEKIIQEEQG